MRIGCVSIFVLFLAGQITEAVTFPQLLYQSTAALEKEAARKICVANATRPACYLLREKKKEKKELSHREKKLRD